VTLVDALVLALLLGAAWSGFRQGLVAATCSLVGALAGAIAGIRLAPLVMGYVDDSAAKVAIGVAFVVLGVGIGEYGGGSLGRMLADRINWRPARAVDHGLGLVGHTLAVLIIIWMIAVPLGKTPYPWLNSAVRSSAVLSTVDEVMPAQLREVSGKLGDLFDQSGFPQILDPLTSTPITDVDPPDAALTRSAAVTRAEPSILKIRALAESCHKQLEGSGFVIAPDRVLTNAHVVAGSNSTTVEVDGEARPATVVLYDPRTDVAVLQVDNLGLPALPFAPGTAESGADAIVAGYPLDGPFTVRAARIRADFDLRGPDIYGNTVTRDVYTVRGTVQSGNSGGPLLDAQGRVLGVVFGAAPDAKDVGFVLTAAEVADEVASGATDTTAADTGACVAD